MKYYPQGLIPTDKKNSHSTSKLLHSKPRTSKSVNTQFKNYPKSVLQYSRETGYHPTQKPVALLDYLIRTYTLEGETVLDFTMGSGSTGVAAVKADRNFIGIELDDEYFKIAEQRIKEAQNENIK